jgi:hypothetical protein
MFSNKFSIYSIAFTLLLIILNSYDAKCQMTASSLIKLMSDATSKNINYEYTMNTSERLISGKGYHYGKSFCKIQMPDFKIYMKILASPNEGTEIIFNQAKYGKACIVNAGKLIPNLSLSPFGKILRKDQHHTFYESGFKYSVDLLKYVNAKMGNDAFNKFAKIESDIMYSGKMCYRLTLIDDNFKYEKYVVKAGETMYSIANLKKVSEFLILQRNKFNSYETNIEGKTIEIPSSFAKKAIIYVDKITYHPLGIEMNDEIGMFEKYEFTNVNYTAKFEANEFTKDCSKYGF